jgi:hypothetical protein
MNTELHECFMEARKARKEEFRKHLSRVSRLKNNSALSTHNLELAAGVWLKEIQR